jgi:glutamyl-Q tRNA(Asp) synthetase
MPSYAHLPLASNAAGEKLSKQTLAPALEIGKASMLLVNALRFLGQQAPLELQRANLAEVWSWAHAHWDFASIPQMRTILPG